ncbi:hypothetical protein LTS08_007202 [Lithohypha guttulata]|uniref:Enoyl reductase (ER) domain-containing protein n=1 Tax=Lithohypha guttulata TaxID=1690604 RepID=A0AAN7YHX2_9EURO|nr:hypothetical protein LTR05_003957 [Lithohypha guttulata]KAK5097181.1 hypothetical protein LTS08_007202 [Lithohypha guttulata]
MASRPSTMRAWQKHFGSTKPELVEVRVPSAPTDGLLVKVLAAGVCHSDVALLAAEPRPPTWPNEAYTLGHEGCGEVVEVGSSVNDFKVGDIVAILSVAGCVKPTCPECSRGLTQLCQSGERYGIGYDGSYAPYVAIKEWSAVKLPAGVSVEEGAVATDACMTAFHALETGQIEKGETVMIVGIGGLGFNAVQIALSLGVRVIARDKRQEVLDEAVRFGVEKKDIIPVEQSIVDFVKDKRLVVDTIIDFAGTPETFSASQEAVRIGGKIVQVGLLGPELAINNILSVRKQLSILCSYGGTMDNLKECLSLIASGKLRPQVVKGDLQDLPRVLEELHAGRVKSRIALVP